MGPGVPVQTSRKTDYAMRAMMSEQLSDTALRRRRWAADARQRAGPPQLCRGPGRRLGRDLREGGPVGARSPSAALHDLYAREATDIDAVVRAFPCPAGATGIAVGIGGQASSPRSCSMPPPRWPSSGRASWRGRIRVGGPSARGCRRGGAGTAPPHPDEGALGRMLERAQASLAEAVVGPSVGEGFDIRLAGTRVRGGALVANGHLVHVELFRVEA